MNTNSPAHPRPALDTLACVNERCTLYGQAGKDNLTVRKTVGKDGIRYLHCLCCGAEFNERKNTALLMIVMPSLRPNNGRLSYVPSYAAWGRPLARGKGPATIPGIWKTRPVRLV